MIKQMGYCFFVAAYLMSIAYAQQVMTAIRTYQPDPDESLVYVSGVVREFTTDDVNNAPAQPILMPINLSVLGSQDVFDEAGLSLASGVDLRFWQPDQANTVIATQTNEQGQYVVGLENGVWKGQACGSSQGFYPSAWRMTIENNQLVSLQAETQKPVILQALTPNNLFSANQPVTLYGEGFGCNGEVIIRYSNAVSRCGTAEDVRYDVPLMRIQNFTYRSDTQVTFLMPELHANRDVLRHIAIVQYKQGSQFSQAVMIGENVQPALPSDSPLCLDEQATNAHVVNVIVDNNGASLVAVEVEESAASETTSSTQQATNANVVPTDLGKQNTTGAWSQKRSGLR